jgi:hypothetical protein
MLTLRLARSFSVHSPTASGLPSAVLAISWLQERDGRRGPKRGNLLISTGTDDTACLCDVDTSSIVVRLHLGTPATKVSAHPRAPLLWLVTFADVKLDPQRDGTEGEADASRREDAIRWPLLVDISAFRKAGMDLTNLKLSDAPSGAVFVLDCLRMERWRPPPPAVALDAEVAHGGGNNRDRTEERERVAAVTAQTDAAFEAMRAFEKKKHNKCSGVPAEFSSSGDVIFLSGLGSAIIVLQTVIPPSGADQGVKRAKVVSISTPNAPGGLAKGAWARGMVLRNDKLIAVYSTGKSFCLYKIQELPKFRAATSQGSTKPEPLRIAATNTSFQDNVNNTKWSRCVLSGDGEFVVGVVSTKGVHALHVWDVFGNFMAVLECPTRSRGVMRDCCWHPSRPIVACVDSAGDIFLWTKKHSENWSAFAPNFTQIDDSVEYIEREDEFDVDEQAGVVFDAVPKFKKFKTEQDVPRGSAAPPPTRLTNPKELASATAAVVLGKKNSEDEDVDVIEMEQRAVALIEVEALAEDEEEANCSESECVGSLLQEQTVASSSSVGPGSNLPFYCRVDRSGPRTDVVTDVPVSREVAPHP